MWKRSLFVLFFVFALSAAWPGKVHAADQVTLTPGHVEAQWRNINDLLLDLAGAVAMDDTWLQKLRAIKPKASLPSDNTAIARAIARFEKKVNMLLDSEDLKKMPLFPQTTNPRVPVLYTRSGRILDGLALYLIKSDSLATVGVYYKEQDFTNKSNADVVAEINIAAQRLDSFITESGL